MRIRIVHQDSLTAIVQRPTRDGGKWNKRNVFKEINKKDPKWRDHLATWCYKQGHTVVSEIGKA